MSKKNQETSSPKQKASTRKWADEVIAIAENSNQGGLEIRFNAEPSPQLQSKLRVRGFRHSRTMSMWYGDKTAEALEFADQVKAILPTSPEGPDLFLSPSFEAVKSNIEKKEFSFIIITLKDGQVKNFIVFEQSKPRAEVIATNFAKQEFGDEFLALAAKPRTHIREARVLFDEGKIIGANEFVPKSKTIHQEIKAQTEAPKQDKKISLREVLLTTKEENLHPLYKEGTAYSAWSGADLYVKGLIGKFSDVYYKAIWQDGETLEGSVDLEPKDFYAGKEEILSSHVQYFLSSLSKERPNVLYPTKAIEKAKKLLAGYELKDVPFYVPKQSAPAAKKFDAFAVLKQFHDWLKKDGKGYEKVEQATKEDFDTWLKETEPDLSGEDPERVWNHHLALVKAANKLHNKIHGVPQMQPYSSIYKKLMQVIPDLIKHIQDSKYHGKSVKDPKGGLMDLNYDYVGKDKKGNYLIAISHYFEQNGDLVADPDMQIRILPELEAAEAMTYQDQFGYQEVYQEKDGKQLVDLRRKKDLNKFLNQWLTNIIQQGHKIDLSKEESETAGEDEASTSSENSQKLKTDFERQFTPEEEKEIIKEFLAQGFTRLFSAQDAFDQQYPVIDVAFRYDEPTEYFRTNIEEPHTKKILQLRKELKELTGKGTNEKRSSLKEEIEKLESKINKAEKLIQDETLIFNDDLFQIALNKAKEKGYHPEGEDEMSSFRDYVTTNVFDNRAIENYHRQPVNEVVDELIDEYFNEEKKASDGITISKTIAIDLKSGDTFVPNVLVPSATTEPFHSHIFKLYDMTEVIKNNFPHLLEINNANLGSASPIAMFELMQFGHPNDYGIDVYRQQLIKEWEIRGKSIFKEIGFPTDDLYPYVNLHTGYESIEPLKEMLFDNNPDGDEWWAIAEHSRPIADMQKALKIVEQLISKKENEKQQLINPKTGKPKGELKKLASDLNYSISELQKSKEVIQAYINQPSGDLENEEEESEADVLDLPLTNDVGVYTEKTAGENYEEIKIPIPKTAQYRAEIKIATTSQDDFRMGVSSSKLFGDYTGGGYAPSAGGRAFPTRTEALRAGLVEIIERLNGLIKTKDTILNNEEKKVKQLTSALDAVKSFANENNIDLLKADSKSLGKVSVKEIYLTTEAVSRVADFSKAFVARTWEQADNFVKGKIGRYSDVYYKVIWEDGETFKGYIDIEPPDFFKHKHSVLSEHLQVYFRNVSNADPSKDGIVKKKDVEEAKAILSKYSFSDSALVNQNVSSPNQQPAIIKGLEAAYWIDENNRYPQNKVIVKGMEFDQSRLRKALEAELLKLPLQTLQTIADELSKKFHERKPLNTYEKSYVTIGKTGDKRKATLITIYVDNMIVENDMKQKSDCPVMTFLIELLFADAQKLVDLPQHLEKKPETKMKKQSQHELNKEIEAFINEKDENESSYTAEEKNYIQQYTGSGGLLKEGASGRGVLYEYYTPDKIVQKMWGLANKFGYDGGRVLEPSVGTGNFLKYAPKGADIYGFETNHYAARISQICYPHARIHEKPFESIFFTGNVHLKDKFDFPPFSLIIGNPPYGEFSGRYAGMGEKQWTGVTEYEHYFMLRGLDLLKENGLLVFIIPSRFLENKEKFNSTKEKIAEKADFLDAYRLPSRLFETTDIGTDIVVFKKKLPDNKKN